MARDTNEPVGETRGQEQDQARVSLRETIDAAVAEHSDTEEISEPRRRDNTDVEEKEAPASDSRQREPKQRAARPDKEDEGTDDNAVRKDVPKADRDSSAPGDKAPVEAKPADKTPDKPVPSQIEAPPYYKNKGKAAWEKLDDAGKNLIIAREQEVSNGFAQVSERLRASLEMEQVIAPRLQAIQRFGVTPAQTVDKLFQWMEALSDSNRQVESFRRLARSFNIDLNQLTQVQSQQQDAPTQQPQQSEYNLENDPRYQNLQGRVAAMMEEQATQRRAAAAAVVNDWAKDKPYYGQVAQLMGQLIAGGAIPLKNDNVDLDGAYEAAIKMHPEVSAQIQQEAAAKAEKEAADKAAKDAKEKAEKVQRARRASAGFKPAAPAPVAPAQRSQLNGKKSPDSIRDSIRAAMSEVRDNG